MRTPEEEKAIIEAKASYPPMRKVPKGIKLPTSIQVPAILRYFLAAKEAVPPEKIQEITYKMAELAADGDVKCAEWIRKVFLPDGWMKELTKELPEEGRIIDYKANLVEHLPKLEQALDAYKAKKDAGT
jgi:hypothetical protein